MRSLQLIIIISSSWQIKRTIKYIIIIINNYNWILPGLIRPTELCRIMASRHSTGFTYSLASNWCYNTSMRGGGRKWKCAICGRGVAFTDIPHRVFPLRPDVRDLTKNPSWLTVSWDSMGNCWPPRFRFMISLPRVQPHSLHAVQISLNSAIFLYTAGPATFHPLTAALDSSRFVQGGEREKFSLFHLTLQYYFSSQSKLLPPRLEDGSLAWESGLLTNRLAETAY